MAGLLCFFRLTMQKRKRGVGRNNMMHSCLIVETRSLMLYAPKSADWQTFANIWPLYERRLFPQGRRYFMRYATLLLLSALFAGSGCSVTSQTRVCYKSPPTPKLNFKRHTVPIYLPSIRLESRWLTPLDTNGSSLRETTRKAPSLRLGLGLILWDFADSELLHCKQER